MGGAWWIIWHCTSKAVQLINRRHDWKREAKKWARQIIDDAIRTVNANIKLVQANIERTKEKPSGAFHREMDTLTQVGESLVKALKTYKNAGDLIDRRGQFESRRIINLIDNINMQKSNGKWKPKK